LVTCLYDPDLFWLNFVWEVAMKAVLAGCFVALWMRLPGRALPAVGLIIFLALAPLFPADSLYEFLIISATLLRPAGQGDRGSFGGFSRGAAALMDSPLAVRGTSHDGRLLHGVAARHDSARSAARLRIFCVCTPDRDSAARSATRH
jgi:hypothetical protein